MATYTPGSVTFQSVISNYYSYYESGCGGGTPGGPAGYYSTVSTPWVGPATITTTAISGSASASITLSIVATEPPAGAVVHYYGVNERLAASATGVYYFAGVPSTLNIKSTATPSTLQALSLGGPSITLTGAISGGNIALPSILMPDGVALIQYPTGTVASAYMANAGTWYFSGACAGIAVTDYSPVNLTSAVGVTTVIASSFVSPSSNIVMSSATNGTITPTQSVVISASNAGGGAGYSIVNGANTYTGNIGYVVGY